MTERPMNAQEMQMVIRQLEGIIRQQHGLIRAKPLHHAILFLSGMAYGAFLMRALLGGFQ